MKGFLRSAAAALLAAAMLPVGAAAVSWGLSYRNGPNAIPSGPDTAETLSQYGAYFMGSPEEKVIYLTFDCGYENGCTESILNTLKKCHVPASFFLTGHYIKSAPALVQRMVDDGHLLCSHTNKHADLTQLSAARFSAELAEVDQLFADLTGRHLAPFLRPPSGVYDYSALSRAQANGYATVLWSIAYYDWDPKDQPAPAKALSTLRSRAHNGAVLLLHTVSATNASILEELINGWKAEGYTFATLSALPGLPSPTTTAIPSSGSFTVNGSPVSPTSFLINGNNYIRLRDVAQALAGSEKEFAIDYDAASNCVSIQSNAAYAGVGGELAGIRDAAALQAIPSPQTVLLNGSPLALTAYSIDNTNYVKLRDLAAALDFGVGYDSAAAAVSLLPALSYTPE